MTDIQTYPNESKVWVYQANRVMTDSEIEQATHLIKAFTSQWVSHNQQLKATGSVLHRQFVVLLVDETHAGTSGCSVDKSIHFIQQLGALFGIDFFDRLTFAYWGDSTIRTVHRDELSKKYAAGEITADTIVFDNLVATKAAFDTAWQKPLSKSWHRNFL